MPSTIIVTATGFNGFNQIRRSHLCEEECNDIVALPLNLAESLISARTTKAIVISWSKIYILQHDGSAMTLSSNSTASDTHEKMTLSLGIQQICCTLTNTLWVTNDGLCHRLPEHDAANIENCPKIKQAINASDRCSISDSAYSFIEVHSNDFVTLGLMREANVILFDPASSPVSYQPLVLDQHVKSVVCGKHHVLLLTESGSIYSWGTGSHGELGHGTVDSESQPRLVDLLHGVHVKIVSAGNWHSVATGSCGEVYVWGWNERGQLGLPHFNDVNRIDMKMSNDQDFNTDVVNIQTVPQLLEIYSPSSAANVALANNEQAVITKVVCGSRHTVALNDAGVALAWGWNEYGQLGLGDTLDRDKPTVIDYFVKNGQKILDVFAGFWNTAFISITI